MFHKIHTWGSQPPGPQNVALSGEEVTLDAIRGAVIPGRVPIVDLDRTEATVRMSYKLCFHNLGDPWPCEKGLDKHPSTCKKHTPYLDCELLASRP